MRAQGRSLRPVTEGALLAGVAVVLALAGLYLPVAGLLLIFLWPIPIVIIHVRHGLRFSLLTVVVTALALTAIIGPLQALAVVMVGGLVGLTLGGGFQRRLSPGWTYALGVAGTLVSLATSLVLSMWVFGINPLEAQREIARESVEAAGAVYGGLGLGEQVGPVLEVFRQQVDVIFGMLFPGALLLGALLHALVNYTMAVAVLRRLGHEAEFLPPFARWRIPAYGLGVLVLALALAYVDQTPGAGWAGKTAQNLMLITTLLFTVSGAALAYFFLSRYIKQRWLRAVILIYALLTPLLSQVLVFVGIADAVFDFRTMIERRTT